MRFFGTLHVVHTALLILRRTTDVTCRGVCVHIRCFIKAHQLQNADGQFVPYTSHTGSLSKSRDLGVCPIRAMVGAQTNKNR